MNEASKAAKRRKLDPRFSDRFFVGRMLDVGCGNDPVKTEDWPGLVEVVPYDKSLGNKDGQYLSEFGKDEFDVVHSSHSLEHMQNARAALSNWLRVTKPGGFVVCSIPDEWLYEYGQWPSRFNGDHKGSFTLRSFPAILSSQNILQLLWKLPVDVESVNLLTVGWDPAKVGADQTMTGAESAIEFVVRKPSTKGW